MSSLAQDELGHAAALYGLLGELTGTDAGRARVRPRAGRVPARPPARPRPRRLGDDDRAPLPVRDRRRRPAGGARRRVVGAAGRPVPQAGPRGALPPHAHRVVVRATGRDAGRAARPRLEAALADAGARCRDGVHATRRRGGPRSMPGSWPRRWPSSRRAGGPASPRRSPATACRCRHRPIDRHAAGPTTAPTSTGSGASSTPSAGATRERPGERGRDPDRHRPSAGGRSSRRRVRRATPSWTRPPSAPPWPRSWTRNCRWSRSSTSGWSARSRSPRTRSRSSCSRPTSVARRSSSSAAPSRNASRAFGGPVRVTASFATPWTSDRITPAGLAALASAGIAPPTDVADTRCPLCASADVVRDSLFGPTQCRSLYYCRSCRQPFEAIKPV